MIEKMEKVFIYGLAGDASRLMRDVMKCGCLQITDPRQLEDYSAVELFEDKRSSGLYDWEQHLSRVSAALSTLAPFMKAKGFLTPKPDVTYTQLEDGDNLAQALSLCDRVEALQKQLSDLRGQLGRVTFQRDSLLPWQEYTVPMGETETKTCYLRPITLPVAADPVAIEQQLAASGLGAVLYRVSGDKDQQYLALLVYKEDLTAAEDLVRQQGASRVSFADFSATASQELAKCQDTAQTLGCEIAAAEGELQELGSMGDLLKLVFDSVQTQIACKKAEQKLLHTQETCLLGAWMPVAKKAELERLLEGYTCFYHYEQPQNVEETPVLLKNSKWIAPFETVTEMYSLPSSGSIDPNPFMAPFFFLFFGMMLSDAGYGLILLIGGLVGSKLMGGNKLMKMLGYCGVSTIFWGLLYGSFFGDAITQVLRTFFDIEFTMPMLIDPLKDPMTILIMSFAFGMVHVFVGMGLKAYLMVKRGHPWAAFFDVGMWYFVLVGLLLLLAGGVLGTIGQYLAIAGAVGLVLTQGRDKKNIFMKAASGLLSLYDITGYFSDVLSYSRIMALGLATGVIASVINTMGTMPGKNIIGVLAFLVIFVFGHLLNFGINALGSYVHTSRLQYVEFFGKFFEGGGGAFRPLRANTKYVNINKQEDN